MGFDEVMKLRIRAFWLLNSNITRLMAERDVRTLNLYASAQNTDEYKKTHQNLVVEMGETVKLDPIASAERDEVGFQELKSMV